MGSIPSFEQPSEILKLFIIKVWRNVKTPESEEESCHQLEAAVYKRRPEDRLELPTATGRQFCSAGMR